MAMIEGISSDDTVEVLAAMVIYLLQVLDKNQLELPLSFVDRLLENDWSVNFDPNEGDLSFTVGISPFLQTDTRYSH